MHSCHGLRLATALLWLLLAATGPAQAAADPVETELNRMGERLERLEQELEATRDELSDAQSRADAQEQVLERAGLIGEEPSSSTLSRFYREVELSGWVSASYFWNWNRPTDQSGRGENTGNPVLGLKGDGLGYDQHPDHNSFQFDQLWFSMQKRATAESRGGFEVDIVFGQTADALRDSSPSDGDLTAVYQAVVEYLAPVGDGVLVRAGLFEALIGAEPTGAIERFNVTEGILTTQLHPASHVGVIAEARMGPFWLRAGGANDALLDLNSDVGDGKVVLFGAGVEVSDGITLDVNGLWGSSATLPGSNQATPSFTKTSDLGIVDMVIRWDPSDLLSTYVEFTYLWTDDAVAVVGPLSDSVESIPGDPQAYGLAVGSHFQVTEQSGFAFRGEAVWGEDNLLDPTRDPSLPAARHRIWSITGTFDHAFTENLVVRFETRWDAGSTGASGGNEIFYRDRGGGGLTRDQWTTGVEAYYRF